MDAALQTDTSAIINISGHPKLDSLKAREITLLTFPQGMLPFKDPTAAKTLMVQRDISLNYNSENLAREAQQ